MHLGGDIHKRGEGGVPSFGRVLALGAPVEVEEEEEEEEEEEAEEEEEEK